MNESIYRVSLDLADTSSSAKIKSKRGDTSRALHITLATNGRPYVITEECTAVFTATKPSGRVIFNNCEIEDNVVVYQFTEQTCVEVGALPCEIRIYGADNKVITSARFTMYIEPTVYSEDVEIESEHEINALTELISEATTLVAEVERKLADGEFNGKDYVLTEADKQEIASMIDVNVDGVVGGYYTPEVSQVDENTMKVSFTASGDKMPSVPSTEITLPAGKDGVSPTVTVSDITGGHRITITDANGEKTIDVLDGKNGEDYVLTEADKKEIADMVEVDNSDSSQSAAGLSKAARTLLITILKNATFSSDQTANILALEAALASNSDGEVEQPDGGIEQTGNILSIVSGVTAIKTDAVLTIA